MPLKIKRFDQEKRPKRSAWLVYANKMGTASFPGLTTIQDLWVKCVPEGALLSFQTAVERKMRKQTNPNSMIIFMPTGVPQKYRNEFKKAICAFVA